MNIQKKYWSNSDLTLCNTGALHEPLLRWYYTKSVSYLCLGVKPFNHFIPPNSDLRHHNSRPSSRGLQLKTVPTSCFSGRSLRSCLSTSTSNFVRSPFWIMATKSSFVLQRGGKCQRAGTMRAQRPHISTVHAGISPFKLLQENIQIQVLLRVNERNLGTESGWGTFRSHSSACAVSGAALRSSAECWPVTPL